MKQRELIKRCLLAVCMGTILVASQPMTGFAEEQTKAAAETADEEVESDIEIGSVEDFLSFAENCKYDSWSLGKTVTLTADLDLSGTDFEEIAYFNGTFEGNHHSITNLDLEAKGSDCGLFRYVGTKGTVKNLQVSGKIRATGSQENIGGIVGVNAGVLTGCSFKGTVEGIDAVGAIAGKNDNDGTIHDCTSDALILATNNTGGIAGINDGVISECSSASRVNIEELEPTLDLAGMDMGSFNVTRNVINRNNMGGIAGYSTGLVTDCKNEGTIGYKHTGYNVGGIVGDQCGIVLNCTNQGEIYGRKDVGGIVGQAEPYVESEYLDDKVDETKSDINRLNRTLSGISSTVSSTSSEVKKQADNLNTEYRDSIGDISGNLNQLTQSVDTSDPNAQGAVDNINAAWGQIEAIQNSGGELTEEQRQEIQNNLNTINSNLGDLQSTYDNTGSSAEELTDALADQLGGSTKETEIKDLADTVDRGVQSVTNSMKSAINQINAISNSISDDIASVTSDEQMITDISSSETTDMDGVISGCKNYGKVNGDLNAGGIAGTMNIEYDGDPEFDFDFSVSLNITLRSTVNDVMIHCINYGSVSAKKNCAGGAVGLQELGFAYDSENYGDVSSDSGNYLGGIAGNSAAAVEKCYSLCNLDGADYVGGICGSGYRVKDSVSVCEITSEGERIGSVAGYIAEDGTAEGNRFVSDELHGIDDISYAGVADRVSYEDVMNSEDTPEGFLRVTVVFETEDEVIEQIEIPYGGTVAESDFPEVKEKAGYYVEWPEEKDLTDIRQNLTVTAEYVPWIQSVASEQKMADGKPVFLATGEFYEETGLLLEETDGPEDLAEDAALAYAYAWELSGTRNKTYETTEAHLAKPETEGVIRVWVKKNGTWEETAAEDDGSYVVAAIPYGADVAVTTEPDKKNERVILGGVAAAAAAAGVILWRRKKKKASR